MKQIGSDPAENPFSIEQADQRAASPEEGLRLISAFHRIDCPRKREVALELVETLAEQSQGS